MISANRWVGDVTHLEARASVMFSPPMGSKWKRERSQRRKTRNAACGAPLLGWAAVWSSLQLRAEAVPRGRKSSRSLLRAALRRVHAASISLCAEVRGDIGRPLMQRSCSSRVSFPLGGTAEGGDESRGGGDHGSRDRQYNHHAPTSPLAT